MAVKNPVPGMTYDELADVHAQQYALYHRLSDKKKSKAYKDRAKQLCRKETDYVSIR